MAKNAMATSACGLLICIGIGTAPLGGCSRRCAPPTAPQGSPGAQTTNSQTTTGTRPGCETRFKEIDTNGDDQITREEFMAVPHRQPNPEQVFTERDANGDGILTPAEFCSGPRMGMGPGMGAGQGMGGMGMKGMMQHAMMQHAMLCSAEFSTLDADRSGAISRTEFAALFDQLDRDRNGGLSDRELCGMPGPNAGAPAASTAPARAEPAVPQSNP